MERLSREVRASAIPGSNGPSDMPSPGRKSTVNHYLHVSFVGGSEEILLDFAIRSAVQTHEKTQRKLAKL